MEDDRARWDQRYAAADAPTPRAPDALVANGLVDHAPTRGRLLDVACGTGPVTLWAIERGLDVVALDVSGVAIQQLTAAVERLDTSGRHRPALDARQVDLDHGLPHDLARPGSFDMVVCQRFKDPEVLRALPSFVAPSGVLVVTVLSRVGADHPGPFHAVPGELTTLLPVGDPAWHTLAATEADGEASIVLRRSAHIDHRGD